MLKGTAIICRYSEVNEPVVNNLIVKSLINDDGENELSMRGIGASSISIAALPLNQGLHWAVVQLLRCSLWQALQAD